MAAKMEIVTELPVSAGDSHKPDLFAQLDDAFSKLFTKSDDNTYLSDQVSESGELRIDDICKNPSILEITPDTDLIKRAIYKSKSLRVCSESTVKSSAARPEQNTLILRDIPSSTPSGDILQIFSRAAYANGACPTVQSVRADMNDTWFVTFATESDAKTALAALRDCKFQDKPVRARLKTESTIKSFYSAPGSAGSTSNKGNGSFSPSNRGPSAAPSPTAAAQGAYSPAPGPSGGLAQAAFFGAYPVPPPHAGAQAPPQGPPSAYANMVLGPDGKPAFAPPPGQTMYGHPGPGQQPFADSNMAGYNPQHPGGQLYGNRRYNRGANGYMNNQGYNNNRGGQGGYRQPGGRGQRPAYQYQQQHHHQHQHMPMGGYMQAMPPLAQMPPPSAAPNGDGAPAAAQEAGTGLGTPRSGAGSTTVDGSSPDDSAVAASTATGAAAAGDQPATDAGANAADQPGPHPLGAPAHNPPPGHVGPYVNFAPPGPAPAYFPNFAFNGAPMPYPGFLSGGPPALSPLNFPAGSAPQGFFPLQMSPMHHMPQHMGFQNQHPHGYSPRHQQGHAAGGGEGGARQQGHHRQHGGSPRSSYNSYGQGFQPQGGPQQHQQHYQQHHHQQQMHGGGRGAAHRSGNNNGAQPEGPAAAAPAAGDVDAAQGDPASLAANAPTDRKVSGSGSQQKGSRERKNSSSGGAAEEKDAPTRSSRASGAAPSETPATGEVASTANNNRRRLNSANSETAGRRMTGGESSGSRKAGQKGEKGGERGGGGEKKKGGRDKGRGEKGEHTAAAPSVKRADFNLEADFPTLVDGEGTDKAHAPTVSKPAAFDYANAARKASQASQAAAAAAPIAAAVPPPTLAVEASAPTGKGGMKHTDKKSSECAEEATATAVHSEAPAAQETVANDAKQSASHAESASTPATTSPLAASTPTPAQSSPVGAASPSAVSSAPAVESFTFGSVVAPVVTTTDKAAMQFGTASVSRGAAAAPAVTSPAASVPSSSSSAAATTATATAIAEVGSSSNKDSTTGSKDDTTSHQAQPSAAPQASTPKPAAAADAGKTITWGAKKSFADILQRSDRA